MNGLWLNVHNFYMTPIFKTKPTMYFVEQFANDPLTWQCEDGSFVRCDRKETSDMLSIPGFAQNMIPRDSGARGGIFHDSGYQKRGLYFATSYAGPYVFRKMSRKEVDEYLYPWVKAEGIVTVTASAIYYAVRVFGNEPWENKAKRREEWKHYKRAMDLYRIGPWTVK